MLGVPGAEYLLLGAGMMLFLGWLSYQLDH